MAFFPSVFGHFEIRVDRRPPRTAAARRGRRS
jgi:hypothetical protein